MNLFYDADEIQRRGYEFLRERTQGLADRFIDSAYPLVQVLAEKAVKGALSARINGETKVINLSGAPTTSEDLTQEGVMNVYKGLKRWSEKYQPLSFVEVRSISGMMDSVRNKGWLGRVSKSFRKQSLDQIKKYNSRREAIDAICENITYRGQPINLQVAQLLYDSILGRYHSVDDTHEDGTPIVKKASDPRETIEDKLFGEQLREELLAALDSDAITERNAEIIKSHFGIGRVALSNSEIARRVGVSEARVSQVVKKTRDYFQCSELTVTRHRLRQYLNELDS